MIDRRASVVKPAAPRDRHFVAMTNEMAGLGQKKVAETFSWLEHATKEGNCRYLVLELAAKLVAVAVADAHFITCQ